MSDTREPSDPSGGSRRFPSRGKMPDSFERLRRHVDVLAELIGERNTAHPAALEATRTYLTRELERPGHAVSRHVYAIRGRDAVNLELALPGTRPGRSTLVVGAHYDTAPGTPGADDNASAVAVLLEVARAFASDPPRRPVRLVCFDCEEPPHFAMSEMGSAHHARQCRARGERLLGMVCLESLGYFVPRNEMRAGIPWYLRWIDRAIGARHVVIVSDVRSIPFGLRFVGRFLTSGRFPFVPFAAPRSFGAIALSDHRSYWEQDYRALMVTDTAFLRNPNYHEPTDRLATLDLPRLSRLSDQIVRAVRRMA